MATGQTLVQQMSQLENAYWSGAADGGGSTTNIIDATLAAYGDGFFDQMWLRMTSGGESGEEGRVQRFTKSTGANLLEVALSGTPSAGETFEIHGLLAPSDLLLSLQRARTQLFPAVSRTFRDYLTTGQRVTDRYPIPSDIRRLRDLFVEQPVGPNIVDQLLSNPERLNTTNLTPTNVTLTAVAPTAELDLIPKYDGCVKADVDASQTGTVTEATISAVTAAELSGLPVTYCTWAYCQTASRLSLRLTDTGGNGDGTAHQGNGWELISVTKDIVDSNSTFTPTWLASSGASFTFFIDRGWSVIGDEIPDHFPQPLPRSRWSTLRETGDNRVWIERGLLTPRRQLMFVGEGYVEDPTAYSTTVTLDDSMEELFVMAGLAKAFERFAGSMRGRDTGEAEGRQRVWQNEVNTKLRELGHRPRNISLRRAV